MKIDSLARLFSTQTESAKTQATTQQAAQAAAPVNQDAGAVSVSSSLDDGNAKAEKIARIKEQVANGTYSADSKEVAGAFYREIFA